MAAWASPVLAALIGPSKTPYANADHTLNDTDLVFSQSDSDTKTGWTAGGGLEFAHDSRWLLRAEALYVDLDSEDRTHSATTSGCPTAVCTLSLDWDDEFWVGRIGLIYKFGHRVEVVPLK